MKADIWTSLVLANRGYERLNLLSRRHVYYGDVQSGKTRSMLMLSLGMSFRMKFRSLNLTNVGWILFGHVDIVFLVTVDLIKSLEQIMKAGLDDFNSNVLGETRSVAGQTISMFPNHIVGLELKSESDEESIAEFASDLAYSRSFINAQPTVVFTMMNASRLLGCMRLSKLCMQKDSKWAFYTMRVMSHLLVDLMKGVNVMCVPFMTRR